MNTNSSNRLYMYRSGILILGAAFTILYTILPSNAQEKASRATLAPLLAAEDLDAVKRTVTEARQQLGKNAGVPEVQDTYHAIPNDGVWLTPAEARKAIRPYLDLIEQHCWWKIGLDPAGIDHALRELASIISGCACAIRAGLEDGARSLALARECGDFLIWAQEQAGTGVFPFPACTKNSTDKAFIAAAKLLAQARKDARLDKVVRNGWIFNDTGDGGLQFDNGEAGVAMLELYEVTKETKYLQSAIKAADWAASRPLVPNWNYNSFSVYLLAKTYDVTREKKYLAAGTKKALIGVIPGQLTDGPNAGRWIDAHNARPAYHYIMLRSLVQLFAVMPADDPVRPEVLSSLILGLKARNKDFRERGAANKDKAMEVLIMVNRLFSQDREFLAETLSSTALDSLAKLVSEEYRSGKSPLSPREWGMFLEYVAKIPVHP